MNRLILRPTRKIHPLPDMALSSASSFPEIFDLYSKFGCGQFNRYLTLGRSLDDFSGAGIEPGICFGATVYGDRFRWSDSGWTLHHHDDNHEIAKGLALEEVFNLILAKEFTDSEEVFFLSDLLRNPKMIAPKENGRDVMDLLSTKFSGANFRHCGGECYLDEDQEIMVFLDAEYHLDFYLIDPTVHSSWLNNLLDGLISFGCREAQIQE